MRSAFLSCLIGASIMLGAGCRDSLSGTLMTSETLVLKSASGVQRLSPGSYPVQVHIADGRKVTLQIEQRGGDIIGAQFIATTAHDTAGAGRIPSNGSGQPFDFAYTLTSARNETPLPSSRTACTTEKTETRCQYVTATTGEQRYECIPEHVVSTGSVTTSSARKNSTMTLSGQMLDPLSGRELARLYAHVDRSRSYSAETSCR